MPLRSSPACKSNKNCPACAVDGLFVFILILQRNSTKMRHTYDVPSDDGSRRLPRCPPSHPSMASPSHIAQASAQTARPSGPSTHSQASMGKVSPVLNQWGSTKYSPPASTSMGGEIVQRLYLRCRLPERVHPTAWQRGRWHPRLPDRRHQHHRILPLPPQKWGGDIC